MVLCTRAPTGVCLKMKYLLTSSLKFSLRYFWPMGSSSIWRYSIPFKKAFLLYLLKRQSCNLLFPCFKRSANWEPGIGAFIFFSDLKKALLQGSENHVWRDGWLSREGWVAKSRGMGGYVGSAPACYSSTLGSNPDIPQKS